MKAKHTLVLGIISILFFIIPSLSFGDNSPWPMPHHDPQHTGLSPYVGPQAATINWTFKTGFSVYSSPVIGADGTVYMGSDDFKVYALNGATGVLKWSYTTGGPVTSSPAIGADGTVYVGSWDGKVYALNGATGAKKWSYTTGGFVTSSPAIGADGTVFVGSDDNKVYALTDNGTTVTKKWSYTTGGLVNSSPAIGADGTVYVGSDDFKVYALNGTTGAKKWSYKTGFFVDSSPAIGADGTVYVGSDDFKVYALNGTTGCKMWSYTTGGFVTSSPAIGADGTVYVGSGDGKVYALNGATGAKKWSYKTGFYVNSSPAIGADGTLYVGSDDFKVYALNGATGALKWSYATGFFVNSSPAIGADGTVYVGSDDFKVYAFGTSVTVPNVVGMTETNAQNALQSVGLSVGSYNSIYSNTVPAGYIISQNPAAGTLVAGESSVNLTTSLGPVPATMTVPNVVGVTLSDAENYLSSVALLTTGTVTQVYSSTVAAGYVISQNPAAGTTVATHSAVNLTVSLGPAPNVTVPNVTNMTQAAAQSALTSAGLTMGTVSQAYSNTVAVGYVISQNPSAGATVASGTAVNITISLGVQGTTPVPNVVGMTQAAAQTAITSAGLTVGTITQAYSNTVPSGNVISQTPPSGATVTPGSAVNLTISQGPQPVMVPNVVGMTQAAAQTAITSAGLTVGTITQAYSDTVPSGNVISQSPASGASVASGSAVNLTVSQGPQPVMVPNVVGMTQAAAQTAITSAGLTVGTITQAYSNTVPSGNVISQTPASGATVTPGSAVNLTISQGPQPVMVPNVVGMTQAAAQTAITSAGLTVGTITQAYSDTVPSGNVISQSPASGASVASGSAVSLTVAQGTQLATVPNVVGMAQADAQNALTSANLTGGTITQAYSNTVAVGYVISQNPSAGATVASGTAVNITISLGVQGTTPVPNVVGMTQAAAQTAITSAGLTVGTITQAYSNTVPSGNVISQTPPSGATVTPGSAVNLTISQGPSPQETVPNVVGLTQSAASVVLSQVYLNVGTISQNYSSTIAAGFVISQSVAAGTTLPYGSYVDLVVSIGPPPNVTVPNVVGMAQADAQGALTSAYLAVGTITQAYSDTVPSGNVISQDPASGTSIATGSAVNLTVSQGLPPQETVPNVVGLTQSAASVTLNQVDLNVGTVSQAYSSTEPAGFVISQSVAAGTTLSYGSFVNLVVSIGAPPTVTVPNVVGMAQADAQNALTSADLTVGTISQAYSDTVPSGNVISQDPASGASIATGSPVNLTVSQGPLPQETVPNVVGLTQSAASVVLSQVYLNVGTISQAYSPTVPAGFVISQNPAAGTTLSYGSIVNIVVSIGAPPTVPVPNVVGMAQADAQSTLISANLTVGDISQAYSDTVPSGNVISQDPAAASLAATGSAVDLTVSQGPLPQETVPNVVGMTQSSASVTLSLVYLNVGTISQQYSSTVPAGFVISQSPAAGTTLSYGSSVNLVVSIGASPTAAVPYVVGMTQADAQSTLISANLTVGTITQAYSDTVPSGNVISQDPASGVSVPTGSAVDLTVSIGPQPQETVPDVVGLTQAAASVVLSQVYLNVGTVTQAYSSTVPAGFVISQSVAAGTTLPYGSYVNLVISLGQQ